MANLRLVVAGFVCALSFIGCGPPEFETVTGTVTFDNEPVKTGDLVFEPADTKFGKSYAPIVDGKYTMPARAGANKVVIRASRVVPGKEGPMGPGDVASEYYIPKKYNDESELTVEVKPGAKNEFDFALKSK